MKFVKYFLSANALFFIILLSTGVHLTSCTKETVHDTTTIHDTLTVTDTICHVNVGMVAHYTFTNGSLLDESGNNNNIVFNNATATQGRSGTANSAYLFNGTDAYMKVTNSSSLNPTHAITLVAVVKVNDFYTGTCHYSEILGKGSPDPVQGFYKLRFTDPLGHCFDAPDFSKEAFAGGYGDNIPEGSTSGLRADTSFINKNQWYVVVYTYDGSDSKLFVDGQLKGVQHKAVSFTPNSQDLYIGKNQDPQFPYLFNGVIDELRIYDRALCSCEVDQLNDLGTTQESQSFLGF